MQTCATRIVFCYITDPPNSYLVQKWLRLVRIWIYDSLNVRRKCFPYPLFIASVIWQKLIKSGRCQYRWVEKKTPSNIKYRLQWGHGLFETTVFLRIIGSWEHETNEILYNTQFWYHVGSPAVVQCKLWVMKQNHLRTIDLDKLKKSNLLMWPFYILLKRHLSTMREEYVKNKWGPQEPCKCCFLWIWHIRESKSISVIPQTPL